MLEECPYRSLESLHATLSALMADVAAIRGTFLRNPGDVVHYRDNLPTAIETAEPLVDEARQSYDEMIRQIQESGEWQN